MPEVEPEPKLYNARLISCYIRLFRDKYPHVDVHDLLRRADIDPAALDDPFEWLTQKQVDRFSERLQKYFEDPLAISREAGRFSFSDRSLGLFKRVSLKILGVGYAYRNCPKYAAGLTRSCTYSARELSPNRFEVSVAFKPGVKENPGQEFNRIGILEAAPLLFSDQMAQVESSRKGDTITYTITWRESGSVVLSRHRGRCTLLSLPLILIAHLAWGFKGLLFSVFSCAGLLLLLSYFLLSSKYKELREQYRLHEEKADTIIQSYIDDYDQAMNLNRIGRIVLRHHNLDFYLKDISEILQKMKYPRIAFFVADFEGRRISAKYTLGFNARIAAAAFDIETLNTQEALLGSHYFSDRRTFGSKITLAGFDIFQDAEYPLIFIPIIFDRALIGFYLLSPEKDTGPINKEKFDFLNGVASQIALGIHKAIAFHEIVESDRMKNDVLGIVSHELKNPLQIMMMGVSEIESTGDIASNLPVIKAEIVKLDQTVKNFLSLQSIEAKQAVHLKPLRIEDLLDSMAASMKHTAKLFTHTVEIQRNSESEGDLVYGDRNTISTAVMNLFHNSCKYTPRPGRIFLRYDCSSSECTISVIDNGRGIPKSAQDKVFLKFFQVDSTAGESVGGFGLGLSIAKEIVRLHGGYITIESPLPPERYAGLELGPTRPGTCVGIHLPKHQARGERTRTKRL